MRRTFAALAALAAVATLAACAPEGDASGSSSTSKAAEASGSASGDAAALPTLKEGVLTFGTSDPAYEPWIVDNDPSNGKGFESAVAYAVAKQLGYDKDHVAWATVTFDQIIAPGEKSFDVAVNQVSITEERKANIDFSSSYYDTAQAVVTIKGSAAEKATSIADLKKVKIGAMVGTTSSQVAASVIAPDSEVQLYNDNDQLKQALSSGLVDAIVLDLPTALYVTGAEIDGSSIIGQLPPGDNPDQLGLVLDKGSKLTEAVTKAVDALRADGTLDAIQTEWLTDNAGAPVLK
jgi:polar amino acid transport system substrate-binding protein